MGTEKQKHMNKDNSSILAFIVAVPLVLCLLLSSAFGAKLYTGGEKYEKDNVVALTLTLNGKLIEWVYKENISQCLKSKRIASREVGGERVIFACKSVRALLQEDVKILREDVEKLKDSNRSIIYQNGNGKTKTYE